MLQKIRDNSQSIGAKIFVWFIIIVFGAWGASTIVTSVFNATPVVTVNGETIDEFEVEQSTQVRIQEMIEGLGPDADLSDIDEELIREAALTELIQRELLLQYAENAGMVISSRVIDRNIAQTPDFQIDGVFNGERAQILLQSMGYTPNTYRTALATEGVINQMTLAYGLSGFVTNPELELLAGLLNETRDLRYLLVSLDDQLGSVEVTEEEMNVFYESNQADFMLEERVSIEYLELDKDKIFEEVTVTDAQIRQRYEDELLEYQSQIERRASHILFEAFDDDEFNAAVERANIVKERLNSGESFEDLASEFSDDLGSADFGGDIGYSSGDNFVEEFENALASLELNEVSGPVRTEFGIHLIKLTERSESEIEGFEESRERIERDLKTAEVDSIFAARSEELGNLAFESFDLIDPAEILGLDLQTTGLFSRLGGTGVASFGDVVTAAFSSDVLDDGLNSNLISISPSRSVAIRLLDHREPELQSFDDVQGEIEFRIQLDKIRERSVALGESVLSNMQDGLNIDTLLETQNLSWNQVDGLERTDQILPPELVQNIFELAPPEGGQSRVEGYELSTGEYVVVDLQSVNSGSVEDLEDAELQSLKTFIAQQSTNADFGALILGMQNRAEIIR